MKPISDLIKKGVKIGDIVEGGRSVVRERREFVNPTDGKRGFALFLDHIQPPKECGELFFDLGRAAYNREFFKGTYSRIQVRYDDDEDNRCVKIYSNFQYSFLLKLQFHTSEHRVGNLGYSTLA